MLSCTTGTSASGYIGFSTPQAPWSRPRVGCCTTTSGDSSSATRAARAGSPDARYWTSNSACGKPPKSWIVSGAMEALTAEAPRDSQWALIISTALGRGRVSPSRRQSRLQALSSMAFIGEPWPTNRTGMRDIGIPIRNKSGYR